MSYLCSLMKFLIAVHQIGIDAPTPMPRAHPRAAPSHAIFAPISKMLNPPPSMPAMRATNPHKTSPIIAMPSVIQTRLLIDRKDELAGSNQGREKNRERPPPRYT